MTSSARFRIRLAALAGTCLVLAGGALAGLGARAQGDPGFVEVQAFPHDPNAYTEGLAFRRNALFEGTGLDDSYIRRVDLVTGEAKRERDLPLRYFGEGITLLGNRLFEITLDTHKGWVYDARTFEKLRSFTYAGEGWGLTDDGRRIVMSDGTDVLRFRDPKTFAVTAEIHVTDDGQPVQGLNELEWVNGEIFANVYSGNEVVRIAPSTGDVVGHLDLSELAQKESDDCPADGQVANGIAYMRTEGRLFVTGKYWCHLYEIELTPMPTPSPTD